MKQLPQIELPPEVTPMAPLTPCGNAEFGEANGEAKPAAYRQINNEAITRAAARVKWRKRIDIILRNSPDEALLFTESMIEVGTAAAIALGDAQSTASLLTHLSRRIRAGDCLDF